MKNELICDDIDKIKKKYTCSFLDGICWVENELNYSQFKFLADDLKLDEKIEAKKKRLENNIKLSEEKKISTKKFLDEILHEYNTIKKNAKNKFDSYDSLIRQFDNSYNQNFEKNGSKIIYRSICKDIIESANKYYIKCEKNLILILDKFNSICL